MNKNERKVRFTATDPCDYMIPCDYMTPAKNAKNLTLNQVYILSDVYVHAWYTEYFLAEFPGIPMNSVWFEDFS